jgi:hypothetical protein
MFSIYYILRFVFVGYVIVEDIPLSLVSNAFRINVTTSVYQYSVKFSPPIDPQREKRERTKLVDGVFSRDKDILYGLLYCWVLIKHFVFFIVVFDNTTLSVFCSPLKDSELRNTVMAKRNRSL